MTDTQIKAPSLFELKTRECTVAELQAALVKLIELHNLQGVEMEHAINNLQPKQWRANL